MTPLDLARQATVNIPIQCSAELARITMHFDVLSVKAAMERIDLVIDEIYKLKRAILLIKNVTGTALPVLPTDPRLPPRT